MGVLVEQPCQRHLCASQPARRCECGQGVHKLPVPCLRLTQEAWAAPAEVVVGQLAYVHGAGEKARPRGL